MPTTSILLIEKNGSVNSSSIKDLGLESLSRKVGFKSPEGFALQHTWGQEDGIDQNISLYAKTTGRAGQENKYDFPPPVDTKLFFGTCILVGKNSDGTPVDLCEDDWEEIYEFLFGGFEDIGSEDSDDDDEDDVDTDNELLQLSKQTGTVVKQTKHGYAKDGFVVDDDDEETEDYESEESSVESEEVLSPPRRKGRTPAAHKQTLPSLKKGAVKQGTVKLKEISQKGAASSRAAGDDVSNPIKKNEPQVEKHDLVMEDCESELSEESYES